MSATVAAHYISEKVSKVRWLPEKLTQCDRFVTGSWDLETNFVRVWRLHPSQYADNVEYTPRCHDKIPIEGDVTGLEFVNDDIFAVSCTDGRLSLFNVNRAVEEDQIQRKAHSEQLHQFKFNQLMAPCTSISVHGTDIGTVGEDGCLNVLSANNLNQIKRTIQVGSIALMSVAFANQNDILTANRMGVIRMFDIRVAANKETASFMAACQDTKSSNFVSAMATHPMQKYILICGTEEGSITVWDLRNLNYPFSYISAHNSPITDIGFHRQDPFKLFSAAEQGEVWMWSEKKQFMDPTQNINISAWLSGDRVRSLVDVNGIVSKIRKAINSFDVHGSRMVCGSDAEALYIVDDV